MRLTAVSRPLATPGGEVETILVQPEGEHRFTAVYVHGHPFNAISSLPAAWHLAEAGATTLLVTQPGYGRSAGPPDYCGPKTVGAVVLATEGLIRDGLAESGRVGIWGFSRGAIVTGRAIVDRPDLFGAAVIQSGGYDLETDLGETMDEGLRANLQRETGGDPAALRARSLLPRAAEVRCPLLVIQAEDDSTYLRRNTDRLVAALEEARLEHEYRLLPGEHEQPWQVVAALAVPFLERHLAR